MKMKVYAAIPLIFGLAFQSLADSHSEHGHHHDGETEQSTVESVKKISVVEIDGKIPDRGRVEIHDKAGNLKGTAKAKSRMWNRSVLKHDEDKNFDIEAGDTVKFHRHTNKRTTVAIFGGYSDVEESYGFGGDRVHLGVDAQLHFGKYLFASLMAWGTNMGTSVNTKLTQSVFLVGPGVRYHGLYLSTGIGWMNQNKLINSPSFYYVDPAPTERSDVIVKDNFIAWGATLGYDFKLYHASSSFPYSIGLGPHLAVHDSFSQNGFRPVYSAGVALRLL